MRVTYLISWDYNGRVLEHVYEDGYEGRVARLGKDDPRDSADTATDALVSQIGKESAIKDRELGAADPQIAAHESTTPGTLSPFAKAQYDADVRNINDNYAGLKQVGLKQIGQHGMGRAPTGMMASVINTNDRNQGIEETAAYERAQAAEYQKEQDAIKERLQAAGLGQPIAAGTAASNAAANRFGMGTIGGDVASGVATGLSAIKTGQGIWNG